VLLALCAGSSCSLWWLVGGAHSCCLPMAQLFVYHCQITERGQQYLQTPGRSIACLGLPPPIRGGGGAPPGAAGGPATRLGCRRDSSGAGKPAADSALTEMMSLNKIRQPSASKALDEIFQSYPYCWLVTNRRSSALIISQTKSSQRRRKSYWHTI